MIDSSILIFCVFFFLVVAPQCKLMKLKNNCDDLYFSRNSAETALFGPNNIMSIKNKEVCGIKRILLNNISKERAFLCIEACLCRLLFLGAEDASVLAGYFYRKASVSLIFFFF